MHSPRQQERRLEMAWSGVLKKYYILIGLIAASSLLNFYIFEFSTIQKDAHPAHPLSNSTIKQHQSPLVAEEDGPYTTDALRRNPYLGWQPPQQRTITNFSWIDCISNTAEYTGKAPDKVGSDQPLGCLERPSQLGKSGFSLDKYNETSWIPDVTMLRTMLMHGKDIRGHPYPPRLPRELCRDIILPDQKSTIDEDKHCLREAKIKPTGLLGASTVTISPWNHFGGSQHHNKTSLTVPAPKVLCMVYTVKNSHSTNIRAIRDTWGGGCDGFLAFSSAPDPRLPAIALQHEGPESYDNMWSKVRSIWKYVGKHYLNDFDWFFIGGDDMFVLPNNLRTYLASLAYKDGYADPRSKEYYVGRRFHNKVMEMKLKKRGKFPRNGTLHFNTGGSGYALSQGSLRKFLTVVDDAEHCFSTEKTSAEDVMMARCLHYLGIRVTDTRDVQGRERFHMFMPGRLFNWRNFTKKNNWYLDFNPWGLKNESDCCAPDSVSFHYAKQPALVRHLHALLYHCNSSDSAQPMRNDDPVRDKSRNISAEIPFASVHNDYAIGISDNQLSNSTNNKTAEKTSKEIMINVDYEDLSGGFKNHPHMSALDEQNNPGYVHDVKSLSRNPPKFVFQEKDIACEHNDATMQLLTQRVYVDLDADKRADRLSKEGVKPPRAKIFCHIYTTKKSHDRIQAIRETWGQRCDGFLAASDVTDKSIDAVNILHEGEEKYENMWQKVRSMWSYVYDNYYQDYDWFHIGGDDMYVLVENLRLYLESEEILVASNGGTKPLANDKSPSKKQHPLLIGSLFRNDGNEKETFVTGGGGYTLNKAGLKALVMSFDTCCPHNVTSAEDLLVSYCLNQQGINMYEGKDQNGADRYHHTNPEFIFNFAPQKNPLFWYTYFSTNTNAGVNRTAERPVSFHLKDEFKVFRRGSRRGTEGSSFGWSMKRVHAILYGYCDNVARGPPMATTGWKDGKITFNHWKHPQRKCDIEKKADEICICSEKKVKTRTIMTCLKKQGKDLKSLTSITTTPTASPTKHANLSTSPTDRTVGWDVSSNEHTTVLSAVTTKCNCVDCDEDKICGGLWLGNRYPGMPTEKEAFHVKVHIVVSHCKKSLEWMPKYLEGFTNIANIHVISKCGQVVEGAPNKTETAVIPNVGRCDHAFAYYITDILPKLVPDTTNDNSIVVFLKDSFRDELHQNNSIQAFRRVDLNELVRVASSTNGFACGMVGAKNHGNKLSAYHDMRTLSQQTLPGYNKGKRDYKNFTDDAPFRSRYKTLGDFYTALNVNLPSNLAQVCYGGIFAASTAQIFKHDMDMWNTLRKALERGDNIQEGHWAERSWGPLLSNPLETFQINALRNYTTGVRNDHFAMHGTLVRD